MVQEVHRDLLDPPVLKVRKAQPEPQVQPDLKVHKDQLEQLVHVVVCGSQELELPEHLQLQVFLQTQELQALM
jgi:hypothetical protein